jgi:hypothetical protein
VNIGPYQFVWWSPVMLERGEDDGDAIVSLRLRRPRLWAGRECVGGVYRWCVVLGWLDVRRFATEAEVAATLRRRAGGAS